MSSMYQKTIYPKTKYLLFACILMVVTLTSAKETLMKGPDITGKYSYTSNTANASKTIFLITKTGTGIHLEGFLDDDANESSKAVSTSHISNLMGDYVWVDHIGAYRNNFGKSTYHLYKVNGNTLALRSGTVQVGTFRKVEESLDQLAGSIRNNVSALLGDWNVEGTTSNIGLTSGVNNDLNVRYGSSVYELNKDDGGVFESYSGQDRSGGSDLSIQVVAENRIKLNVSGNTLYASRKNQKTGAGNGKTFVSGNTPQTKTTGVTNSGNTIADPQSKLLFTAIKSGDTDAVSELIVQGVNINGKSITGRTALIESIYQNDIELMEQLLEANANVNLTDNQGRSPLVIAIQKSSGDNMAMVGALLDRSPTITLQAIDESVKKDNVDLARLMLDANANRGQMAQRAIEKGKSQLFDLMVNDYNLPLTNVLFDTALNNQKFAIADRMIIRGFSPLYALDASVKRDVIDLVYTALENGGNANTALSYAVGKKEKELAKLAVEDYGADPNKALPQAVAQNDIEIVGLLLANNASPNGQMSVVSASGDIQMLDLFLTNGADANLGIMPAAKANKPKAVQLLLQNGGNPNILLGYAVENSNINYVNQAIQAGAQANDATLMATSGRIGNLQIVNALLGAGANANYAILPATKANKLAIVQKLMGAGADGASAKLIAASAVHNNPTLTQIFLDAGANAQDGMFAALGASADKTLQLLINSGATVESHMLLTTVIQNSSSCSKILLAQGLSANMKDAKTGFSLLHYSAQNDNPVLTYALLEHNAPVDATANGDTPLHLAVKNRKGIATVDALIGAGANVNALNGKGKSVLKVAKGNKIKKLLKQKGATK